MFGYLKKIFKRHKNIKKIVIENKPITFKDLQLKDIIIQVKPNGNDTMLELIDLKEKDSLIFDREQCLLLATIFNEYGRTNKVTNTLMILEELIKEQENK